MLRTQAESLRGGPVCPAEHRMRRPERTILNFSTAEHALKKGNRSTRSKSTRRSANDRSSGRSARSSSSLKPVNWSQNAEIFSGLFAPGPSSMSCRSPGVLRVRVNKALTNSRPCMTVSGNTLLLALRLAYDGILRNVDETRRRLTDTLDAPLDVLDEARPEDGTRTIPPPVRRSVSRNLRHAATNRLQRKGTLATVSKRRKNQT
jgi:hypothetical protein